MTVRTLPDTLRLVSEFLRADDDVAALVGDRVYTALPSNPEFPCVRLHRLGGAGRSGAAYHLESVLVQVEALGGSRHGAWQLAETLRAVMAQRMTGTQPVGDATAVVSGVDCGGVHEDTAPTLPRNDNGTERHRAHFTAVAYVHPSREISGS